MLEFAKSFISPVLFTALFIVVYYITNKIFLSQSKGKKGSTAIRQITLGLIIIVAILTILLAFPINKEMKGQILNVVGIVFSAAVALNSTTFLGNIFAGLMNKTIGQFKVGDFIVIENQLGKVSEIDLFQTEIQTEDRGLISYSNIQIATNPIKVIRSSGFIISTTVSLGYDVSRFHIEQCLLQAAINADLKDPFVFITELGDFSISYKINGLLSDISTMITARSNLNAMVLDELHNAKIEIVSPTFMNQRQFPITQEFIPKKSKVKVGKEVSIKAEDVFFEKAIKAEKIEVKGEKLEDLEVKIKDLKVKLKELNTLEEKDELNARITKWENILQKAKDKIIEEKATLDKES